MALKVSKVGFKISMSMAIMLVVIFFVLFSQIYIFTGKNAEEKAIDMLQTAADDRSTIIENHVQAAEDSLTAFSRAGEVYNLLSDPSNEEFVSAAQKYTENFSSDIENLEGIYISEWNTHVLAHTNPAVVGITTREGEAAESLQNQLMATDGVLNSGIIISPASGEQIISMYKACYDENGNPIGLTGAGIFTTGLLETLDSLTIEGMNQAEYCLVNVNTGEYIFNSDKEKIAAVAEEDYIKKIIEKSSAAQSGFLSYEENGTEYFSAYNTISDRGWVFIMKDNKAEVFESVTSMQSQIILICIIGLAAVIILSYLIIGVMMRPIKVVEEELVRLGSGDISTNYKLENCLKRNDEFGSIAKTTDKLTKSLNSIIGTLSESCSQMTAETEELHSYSENLVNCVNDSMLATNDFTRSIDSTESAVNTVYSEISMINDEVDEILERLKNSLECNSQLKDASLAACNSSEKLLEDTKISVAETQDSLEALSKINEMVKAIIDVSMQTKMLSINASVEAARAGSNGKGFAVVAQEIRSLANASEEAASDIQTVNKRVNTLKECFNTIVELLETIVKDQYNSLAGDLVSQLRNNIDEQIVNVNTSTTALSSSINNISEKITNVQKSTIENKNVVNLISEKNHNTADIARLIQHQAESNRALAEKLNEIINKFKM